MKQFDTVKNNEWVPVEEDLENTIKVVDTLPTASESELGNTYLLNGAMEGYTKTHFYKCLKDDTTGLYYWSDLNVGRYSVGNCKAIRLMIIDDGENIRVLISWRDPDDVIVGSEKIYWQKTVLVHQVGHMPIDINDGTSILTNTVRDKYAVFGSYSFTLTTDNRVHYFKLFPVSEDNAITNDDANGRRAGYNYQITSDEKPIYTDGVYKTYYKRELDSTTGLIKYTALEYNTENFDGDASEWKFKTTIAYYEYQTSYITWSGLQGLIQDNTASTYFPVGSILVLPYHGDFGEMSYEVVDFDGVQLADSSKKHSMTLQAKYLYRWWDYAGGVVFDTNEKGAAATQDTVRNADKVYFKAIGNTSSSYDLIKTGTDGGTVPLNSGKTNTPAYTTANAIKSYGDNGGHMYVYPESIWDATGVTYGKNFVYNSTKGKVIPTWTASNLVECELPYTTGTTAYTWRPDRRITGLTAQPPSAMPLTDSAGTAVYSGIPNMRINYGTATTSTTTFYGFGKNVTLNAANSTGTMHALNVLGPLYGDISGLGKYDTNYVPMNYTPALAPRTNDYADRFTRVPIYWSQNLSYGRWFEEGVKYFCPIELCVEKYMSNASNPVYKSQYKVWLRDCTEDLYGIVNQLLAATSGDNLNYLRYVSTTYYVDIHAVCSGKATGLGDKTEGTAIMPKLFIPTQDGTYLPGKRYFKFDPKLTTDTSFTNGKFYYRALTVDANDTALKDANDDTYTVYQRVRPRSTSENPKTEGYYEGAWTVLEADTDYTVGDLIPCYTKTPVYWHSRKAAIACAGETPVEGYVYFNASGTPIDVPVASGTDVSKVVDTKKKCFWTNGQIDPDTDEYVEISTDVKGTALPSSPRTITTTYDGTTTDNTEIANATWRYTDIYEAAISYSKTDKSDSTKELENCNLYWKTPNLERVAYGNHVWAQSNLRMYFNGPFDSSQSYQVTVDNMFWTGRQYYKYVTGTGYQLLVADTDYTASTVYASADKISGGKQTTKLGELVSDGPEIYVKVAGGIPVGYKIDKYNPMKYWNYGVSPIQQYKYNGASSTWTGVYDDGDNWWVGQASINNGLVYDRLADMYQSGAVVAGAANNSAKHFTNVVSRNGGSGWNTSDIPVDSTTSSSGSWEGQLETTGDSVSITADKIIPRQSFLHGFMDCMYKRSTDSTYDSTKTYYFRNPYGEYEIQNNDSALVKNGPYKACLYEYNTNWLNDIADAKEFLDAIQPVVNHNGCYGTTAALDFYPQTGVGTTTIDKVWLMSTVQVAGTESHNASGAAIVSTSMNNGVYENTVRNIFTGAGDRETNNYLKCKFALWKYCDAKDASATAPRYGATSLNGARIKYGYTVGQHTTSGYDDKLDVAQYWWLRSAGGPQNADTLNNGRVLAHAFTWAVMREITGGVAAGSLHCGYKSANSPSTNEQTRLSPLITLA